MPSIDWSKLACSGVVDGRSSLSQLRRCVAEVAPALAQS